MKTVAVFLVALGLLSAVAATSGDAHRGRDAFEQTCTGCHALDRAKVGPPLRNIYGRSAGKDTLPNRSRYCLPSSPSKSCSPGTKKVCFCLNPRRS
jgi:cytochrome c2